MPVVLFADEAFPLTTDEVARLWRTTFSQLHVGDEDVSVKCVSEEDITKLNGQYRGKQAPTNVLTFSYDAVSGEGKEHDVAVCMSVAQREASARGASLRDYTALLLVHAFLHAAGLDHERSEKEAKNTQEYEKAILAAASFTPVTL